MTDVAASASHPPGSADAVLEMARRLLEQNRSDEALAVIERYAENTELEQPAASESPAVFDAGVSDQELELAFEAAESDREQMLDADEIAERAIRQTDSVIRELDEVPCVEEDFVSSGSSYATRTVASLLESQGDAPTASRVRAIADSSDQNLAVAQVNDSHGHSNSPSNSPSYSPGDTNPPVRDRRTATIMELERWLVNLRGVAQ